MAWPPRREYNYRWQIRPRIAYLAEMQMFVERLGLIVWRHTFCLLCSGEARGGPLLRCTAARRFRHPDRTNQARNQTNGILIGADRRECVPACCSSLCLCWNSKSHHKLSESSPRSHVNVRSRRLEMWHTTCDTTPSPLQLSSWGRGWSG